MVEIYNLIDNILNSGVEACAMFKNLSEELTKALQEANYVNPTKVQELAIPQMLQGKSILAQAKTGSGKTAAYLIPILEKEEQALVLTPTRELAEQVADEARKLGKYKKMSIGVIIGGVPYSGQDKEAKKDIVIGTPGRILDLWGKGHLDLSRFSVAIVDEVDRMFDMGFIDDVKMILKNANPDMYGFFSATVPEEVESLVKEFSPNIEFLKVDDIKPVEIEHLFYEVKGWRDKISKLKDELDDNEKTIVFVNTKKKVEELYEELRDDFEISLLHGDLPQRVRLRNLSSFRRGKTNVLLSTDLASRGIDVIDVTKVINFDTPRDIETYIHRVGRTGRMGRKGIAITFYTRRDAQLILKIKDLIKGKKLEVQ